MEKKDSELVMAEAWLLEEKGQQFCERLLYSHHIEVHEPARPGLLTCTRLYQYRELYQKSLRWRINQDSSDIQKLTSNCKQ